MLLSSVPEMQLVSSYDPTLVLTSLAIATFASFTGLNLARRIASSSGRARQIWLATSALALGGGIWAMHFIGMLAWQVPGMEVTYSLALTLSSLALPIVLTALALRIAGQNELTRQRLFVAGGLMAAGVLAMHYIGMAAMRMDASVHYQPIWVLISIAIALIASIVAIWLASREHSLARLILASVSMGVAIAGMHYVAMHAAFFTALPHGHQSVQGAAVDQRGLAATITVFSVVLLALALGAAKLDQTLNSFARRERRIALRLEVADILRGRPSDEALQEVAGLMGRFFGVTRSGYGQLDPVEDVFDYDVCWTDGTVPPLLGKYPAADFGERIVADLKSGRTVVVGDLLEDPISREPRTLETAEKVDTRSILVVPFLRGGRLQTIVYLNDRKPRRWEKDDIAFIEELAERTRLIIERETVEQQLRDLNATLEQRVEERSQELREAQRALLQSQKMEAVGQLVAGMAHDFNNVLATVVSGFNLILRKPDDPDRVRRFAEAGAQAAERGAKLTGQLMAFSRSSKLELVPIFVCDVIDGMGDLLDRTLGPMVELKKDLNPSPAPVMADPTQVEMMILNLAINARDAMPDGGTLTLATTKRTIAEDAELPDGDYVEIAVSDTGTGMDAETLRRAMEPFFTTKPVGKGTGLGLAQIYGSARQSKGTVRIESVVGEGTTVRVYLPCTELAPSINDETTSAGLEPHDVPTLRILLVDDDDDLRQMLERGLAESGHTVLAFDDGKLALAQLEECAPEVAIVDFAMPGMNGAVLAEHLAQHRPDLPIIFVSGYADVESIKNAAGENATILRKPFDLDRLSLVLREAARRIPAKAG